MKVFSWSLLQGFRLWACYLDLQSSQHNAEDLGISWAKGPGWVSYNSSEVEK